MSLDVYEIRTKRLLLRRIDDADLPAVLRIQADPEANRYNPREPSEQRNRELVARWQRHWETHGFGYWSVVEAATGVIIGVGGLQTTDHDGEPVLNLYYRFDPESWGQGFAPEMAAAAVSWAEREVPERPVVIVTNVDNAPARRVAEKLGFHEHKRAPHDGVASVFYRRR